MLDEIWKSIPGYEGLYKVSNLGRVKSLHRFPVIYLKPELTNKGYLRVTLSKYGSTTRHSVHRLVASVFIPNPDNKKQVNHIDGNKQNCTVTNLEWTDQVENQNHAVRTGLQPIILNNPLKSKPVDMISLDGVVLKTFPSAAEAERQTGVHNSHIIRCCKGRCKTAEGFIWKYHKEVV